MTYGFGFFCCCDREPIIRLLSDCMTGKNDRANKNSYSAMLKVRIIKRLGLLEDLIRVFALPNQISSCIMHAKFGS